jgi:guanylate kinase
MNVKNERIILLGGTGSGKDFLMKKLTDKGLIPCVKYTTRPKRVNEIDGFTYNFISDNVFFNMIAYDELMCYQKFIVSPENRDQETWYYGISKEDFKRCQIFIMTPGEYRSLNLSESERKNSFVVYLDIDRKVRESRLLRRNDKNDSIIRRLDSDAIDFSGFTDYDLRITDPDFNADDVFDLMF